MESQRLYDAAVGAGLLGSGLALVGLAGVALFLGYAVGHDATVLVILAFIVAAIALLIAASHRLERLKE